MSIGCPLGGPHDVPYKADEIAVGAGTVDFTPCSKSVLDAPLGSEDARSLSRSFAALADPVRLRVLSMLAAAPDGEICVCDFVTPLAKSQGTISHHLRVLGDVGLVHGQRRGKWVWYSLDRDRLASLREALGS